MCASSRQNWPGMISVQPNAGLPELVDGKTHYPLGAEEMASWVERFVVEDGVNLIGGCCGTSIPHIQALDAMLQRLGNPRPAPVARKSVWVPVRRQPLWRHAACARRTAISPSASAATPTAPRNGASCRKPAIGTAASPWAASRSAEGSNALDICTAFVGRNEIAEMNEVITRFTASVNAPLVIDSTETPVIEAALKLHGGKPIINSINFEDGEGHATDRLTLAKKFGAAVIALTIDEVGMAKEPADKLRIARAPGGFRLQQIRPAAIGSADRPAHLHHRHRQ